MGLELTPGYIKLCAHKHQEARGTLASFQEGTWPFHHLQSLGPASYASSPPHDWVILTALYPGEVGRPGQAAGCSLGPRSGWKRKISPILQLAKIRLSEAKQAEFSLTPELDVKHPPLPQDRLDIFPGKSSLISQVSALTALTSDQIGSTRAAGLKTSIQSYVLLGTVASAWFPLLVRCD